MACLASLSQAAAPSSGKPAPSFGIAASICAIDETSPHRADLDGPALRFKLGASPSLEIVARYRASTFPPSGYCSKRAVQHSVIFHKAAGNPALQQQ